jgi:hypothetical protein
MYIHSFYQVVKSQGNVWRNVNVDSTSEPPEETTCVLHFCQWSIIGTFIILTGFHSEINGYRFVNVTIQRRFNTRGAALVHPCY